MKIIDLRNINWCSIELGHLDGVLPKSILFDKGRKLFLKLGSYTKYYGFYGVEPIIEVINSRIGKILGLSILKYDIQKAVVVLNGKEIETFVCISQDYAKDVKQISFEKFYESMALPEESIIAFCKRMGIIDDIYNQIVFDYVICNLDRHGKNTEILVSKEGKISVAPFFDNSLTYVTNRPIIDIKSNKKFNDDLRVNNYIGVQNLRDNLFFIDSNIKIRSPRKEDREILFKGLGGVTTREFRDYVWNLFIERVANVKQSGIPFIQWY